MKILAIDYGTKNIGLAISDDDGRYAGPLAIHPNYGDARAVSEIAALARTRRAGLILLGAPLQNQGSPMYKTIVKFGEQLSKESSLAVKYWDESFSSSSLESGMRGKARKASDSLVATNLLQEYLDYLNSTQQQ